jgi:hypothetical protein
MEQIFIAYTSIEAHLVKGLLESEGIAAEVHEDMVNILGELPLTPENLPSVWVEERDALRADGIVRDFQHERVEKGDAWRCECGEILDAQFSACWQCSRSRPEQPRP